MLDGAKSYVIDGHSADVLVVAAKVDDEVALLAVDGAATEREVLPTMDMTRKQAKVVLDGVRVDASARLEGDGAAALGRTLDLACIALAADVPGWIALGLSWFYPVLLPVGLFLLIVASLISARNKTIGTEFAEEVYVQRSLMQMEEAGGLSKPETDDEGGLAVASGLPSRLSKPETGDDGD